MRKSLMTTVTLLGVALFGVLALAACTSSSGITHLGGGKVAVSVNKFLSGNKTPIIYDCSAGSTCVRIGQ